MYHNIAKKIFKKITVIQSVYLTLSMLFSIALADSLANVWTVLAGKFVRGNRVFGAVSRNIGIADDSYLSLICIFG